MSTVRQLYRMDAVKIFDPSKVYKGREAIEACKSELGIGIEVEVENHHVKANPNDYVWHGTADGSLRNGGLEYVSKPIPASWGSIAIQELLGQCLDENECCFSPRTSIHVHINMQDVETEVVEDIILLYSVFEKLFFRFTGRGRVKNIYCVPLTDTNCLNSLLNVGFNNARGSWSKYSALNLLPIAEYGTIEFRHMHGTFDAKKVSIWIRLLTTLCEYVIAQKGCREEIQQMSQGYDFPALLKKIFDTDSEYLKYQSFADVRQQLGRVRTAFTHPAIVRNYLELRSNKAPFFVGI